jgi:selenocysteine-specific elongation factor
MKTNAPMKHIIAGTAGHIDHGKTALVRALTGIDTDRLEEEKRRGISIDIGFAHLDLTPDVRVGFVDVPGHERFIKNMLAGAGGIDFVMLVIAADESIKPQTREHFDICRLLGIQAGMVVLTKSDLVDPDILGLVRLEAEDFVAGSFLEGAPIVAASAATGAGLDELRAQLAAYAARVPAKDASRHFRLPVDRVFSMRGFGTVVTGTLVSGAVAREQEVEAHPGGARLRVRGIQVHGQPAEGAVAGQRTALNVTGAEPADLRRGMALAAPGIFQAVTTIDCEVNLLASALPLKHRAPVHFHSGTAEVEAQARLFDKAATVTPGSAAFVRFLLHEPLLILPGDRFIIRMFSPVVTIGGGRVVEIGAHRYKRGEGAAARLGMLARGKPEEIVPLLVGEARYGLGMGELIARTGLLASEVERAAAAAGVMVLGKPEFRALDAEWFREAAERILSVLRAFHQQHPLAPGMPRHELLSREFPGAPPLLLDALLEYAKGVAAEGEMLRLATHRVVLREDEEQASGSIERAFESAGLSVPLPAEVLARSGVEPARARTLLQMLLRKGALVKIAGDLVFHRTALEGLRAQLAPHRGERISVARFKDLAGVSRKYAIPLLEYCDRERVTRREGDDREVL